ncbi:transcriptional regulator FtsR [Phytohabitans suffuscus]|uniref:MerR family transcriptional regulator n=1 Tax=Phytohabitans suffuscus TaxID=624315 RepID=A0A6F8Z049_9ACTN|nr:MerR family transcriptional regulator [Phytohabitans suffuscus]BCB91451.1 MerR family transcriptional regulator [Phytohabitans suffuscus]
MSIGEVLAELRVEFPDTTISKLRFLEAEGLVEPSRTAAGYRKYSWDDVARLRFVLSAQRDQYLPLRVIREQLASRDAATAAPVRLVAVGPTQEGDSRLSRDQLIERSGLDGTTLAEVERLGLLAPIAPGRYDADALAVATAVAGLAAFGLEPRHLRAFRSAADREVGLFAQLVAPLARQNDPAAQARAGQTADDLVRLSQQLHAALVRVGLREALGR